MRSPGHLLLWLSLLAWHCALALDPALDLSQYAHKSWKIREGFPEAAVESIAQTTDGYLWLGTAAGLFRFDGIHHVPWDAIGKGSLPHGAIRSLLATHDGSLWIGTYKGLARWADGKVTDYGELAGFDVFSLLEDHAGTVWASGFQIPQAKICAIRSVSIRCDPVSSGVTSLYEDSHHNLWAGTAQGLWRWKPDPSKLYSMSVVEGVIEAKPGAMLVLTVDGVHRFDASGSEMQPVLGNDYAVMGRRMMRDRDGSAWIGTNNGLLHLRGGRTDSYTRSDGLSGNVVTSLYEDREGDVWVGTQEGLDQFRGYPIATISNAQGLRGQALTTLAAADGSVWIGAGDGGLNRWKDGEVTNYRGRPASPAVMQKQNAQPGRMRELTDAGLEDYSCSLTIDSQGDMWVAGMRAVSVLAGEHFSRRLDLGEGWISALMSDRPQSVWISHYTQGLLHVVGQQIAERIPWSRFGSRGYAVSLLSDTRRGGIWLGFLRGGVSYIDGRQQLFYDRQDGLGPGRVKTLYLDERDTLWAATEGGLSRLTNGRAQTLTTKNGLPCPTIHWVIQDNLRSFWLGTSCGVVRLDERELDAWASGAVRTVHPTLLDSTDGVSSQMVPSDGNPLVTKASDGKLWFWVPGGVGIIDPRHLLANPLAPPVHVEQIIADHNAYDASSLSIPLGLPPRLRDLEVDYTALSLVAPEKVQFRYRLEGHDRAWQNVGNRRQAFYTDLPPGNYRFRVIASNNSGVWNENGASLDFSIAPAYWQTLWFRALCVAAILALLLMVYRLRMRQLALEFDMKLEARVDERTRIARELHDTLLQSFSGLLLSFRTVHSLLSKRPDEARQTLERAIDDAREALTEGRQAVQGLRPSALERHELIEAIKTLTEELASDPAHGGGAEVRLNVEGTPRQKRPLIRDEIYRIASEALRNAFRHAEASRIEVQLSYNEKSFELRVRDDGKGIDPELLSDEGLPGHFGLRGMRERAQRIGGKFTLWSAPASGTELVLSVPGAIAYARERARRSWLARRNSTTPKKSNS